MNKLTLSLVLILANTFAFAEPPSKTPHRNIDNYYAGINLAATDDWEVKDKLHKAISGYHKRNGAKGDKLVQGCNTSDNNCFRHRNLGYKTARRLLFGKIHLEKRNNKFFVTTRYCGKKLTNKDFPSSRGLGNMKIPDHRVMNAEHTWPQKNFSKRFNRGTQKADLHALYPTVSHANNARAHMPFGSVTQTTKDICDKVQLGVDSKGNTVFQPWSRHRGDVARALFYFSTRYKIAIDPTEEHILRKWHWEDPVTQKEMDRNDHVFTYQWNRNPYVDFPNLVDRIPNF